MKPFLFKQKWIIIFLFSIFLYTVNSTIYAESNGGVNSSISVHSQESNGGKSSVSIQQNINSSSNTEIQSNNTTTIKNEINNNTSSVSISNNESTDGQTHIELKTKNGEKNFDIEGKNTIVELFNNNGLIILKVKNENGKEVELNNSELSLINDKLKKQDIQLKIVNNSEFAIEKKSVTAISNFPVSINLSTNVLTVDTPLGVKQLNILPDEAFQKMIEKRIIKGDIPENSQKVISLNLQNNIPVYVLKEIKNKKILGFYPIKITRIIFVSSMDGKVTSQKTSFFDNVMDFLSF